VRQLPVRRTRRQKVFVIVPLALVVVAAAVFVIATRRSAIPLNFEPVSYGDMLHEYRSEPGTRREDIGDPPASMLEPTRGLEGFTPPEGGVYTYTTTGGKETLEQHGHTTTRTFPHTTYANVYRGKGCMWEIVFKSAKQYEDSHRHCSAHGVLLCVAHMSDINLAGFREAMTHICEPNMVIVGRSTAHEGGVDKTVCHAHGSDTAKITVLSKGKETVTVGGVKRTAYHDKMISDVRGDVNGKAIAEVWFDSETGMFLKLIRKTDVKVKVAGESANYRIRVQYRLKSLTPGT
jgi:hypothetical protein